MIDDLLTGNMYFIPEEEKQVMEINIDTIRELRQKGLVWEANDMLKKFHDDVKKAKKMVRSDIRRQDSKIKQFFGSCSNPTCTRPAMEGHTRCKNCIESKKKSERRRRLRK